MSPDIKTSRRVAAVEFVRPSLADAVADHLAEAIHKGEHGWILDGERELALRYGIARSTLRKALERLASRGLVVRAARQFTRVVR